MQAILNSLYPNRVQLKLSSGGPAIGPWQTSGGATFDPRLGIEVYLNGQRTVIYTFAFDTNNDQYLLFTGDFIPVDESPVQVVYRLPASPYSGSQGVIPGFAIIAAWESPEETETPVLGVAVPATGSSVFVVFPAAGWNLGGWDAGPWDEAVTPVFTIPLATTATLSFYVLGIAFVRFQSSSPSYDSGMLPVVGIGGSIELTGLTPGETIAMTLTAYDSSEAILVLNGLEMIQPFSLVVEST